MTAKTIFLALAISVGIISFKTSADEKQPIRKTDEQKEQPNSPLSLEYEDMLWYEYNHGTGVSHFILPNDVEYVTFTMTKMSSGIIYNGEVSNSNLDWVQPLPAGVYNLVCTTQEGCKYIGIIRI